MDRAGGLKKEFSLPSPFLGAGLGEGVKLCVEYF